MYVLFSGDSVNGYSVSELVPLGDHTFSSSLTIQTAEEEETTKEHFMIVRAQDAEKRQVTF